MSRKRKFPTNEVADKNEINEQLKQLQKRLKEAETRAREAETKTREAETRAREERTRAIKAEQRLKFITGIDNNSITSRDGMMLAIEAANFEDKLDELKKKIPNTHDYTEDDRSSKTQNGRTKMSSFKRSQVAGTKDVMNVKSKMLPLYQLANKYLSKNGLQIKKILKEEIEILTKIRVALAWIYMNGNKFHEKSIQKVFILYCEGLLKKINDYGIYGVNSIDLEANIEIVNNRNQLCKSLLYGKADVVIGKKIKDTFKKVDKNKILDNSSIIGEIKPSFGSLYCCKSKIGESTDQLLAEMLVISKMRKSQGGRNFVKGVLSDCFFIRMAFRYQDDLGETFYAISSLYETPKDFVLSLIVLISDITVADICKFEDSAIIEDEYEEENANCDENDADIGKSPRENLFSSNSNRAGKSDRAGNKKEDNYRKNYRSKRQPLKTMNSNIIFIGEDPLEEERQADLKNLEEWEACRLGRTYLNSNNLKLLG